MSEMFTEMMLNNKLAKEFVQDKLSGINFPCIVIADVSYPLDENKKPFVIRGIDTHTFKYKRKDLLRVLKALKSDNIGYTIEKRGVDTAHGFLVYEIYIKLTNEKIK